MPTKTRPHWTVYLAIGVTLINFAWALSDRLTKPASDTAHGLQQLRDRVLILETTQKYLHGEVTVPNKE